MTGAGFPHSETPGSKPSRRLPGAYRGQTRPSSAPGTKASTVRPKTLTHDSDKIQGTQKTLQSSNLKLLDARIHYPVHKHPTEPQTTTGTTGPNPHGIGGVAPGPGPGTEEAALAGCPLRTQ